MKWFACEKSTSKSGQSTSEFLHVSPVLWVWWRQSTYPLVRVAAVRTSDLILIHHVVAEELKCNDGHVMHPTLVQIRLTYCPCGTTGVNTE